MEIYTRLPPELQQNTRSFLGPHPTAKMVRWWKRNKDYPIISLQERANIHIRWKNTISHFPLESWNPIVGATPSMQAFKKWILLNTLLNEVTTGDEHLERDHGDLSHPNFDTI